MISTVPENDRTILAKLPEKLAFYCPLNGGLLQLKGEDRIRFLHNQTTNNIQSLKSGQNCHTVFVNSTGRTLDLATAYVLEEAIWIKVSTNRRQFLFNWMDRFLFPMDKVDLTDISEQYVLINLLGKESDNFLRKLGFTLPEANHQSLVTFKDFSFYIAHGNDLGLPGYTLILSIDQLTILQDLLQEQGGIKISDRVWEHLRITQGRPKPEQELTEDYNPLEAD